VIVTYENAVTLSYSLNAFNAWEGYSIVFNGTKGRIEHKIEEQVSTSGDGSVPGAIKGDGTYIRVYPLRQPAYEVKVWSGEGAHGGGDDVMMKEMLAPDRVSDKYLRAADHRAGAYSALVGIAANRGFTTGQPGKIADLVSNIGRPEYPAMPDRSGPVPMPRK